MLPRVTWVFGNATILGSAISVADIQVTVNDDTIDCLRKLYALDHNVLGGFAGDVLAGFTILASLQRYLHGHEDVLEMSQVYEALSTLAKDEFSRLDARNQAGGSEILLAGASTVKEAVYGSRADVGRFVYPDFEPEIVPRGEWASIGSGSDVESYRRELQAVPGDEARGLMPLEANSPGGFANAMTISIIDNVFNMPPVDGVSKHFHVGTVFAHGCTIRRSDRTYFPGDGPPQRVAMPEVADSWPALTRLLERLMGRAVGAAQA
ncbi:MAG: hypothetical protein ACREWE_08460 [Gammaproteobacteria bacterium]